MNVSIAYKAYIHTIYETYRNVEWIKISHENIVLVDEKQYKHFFPIKKLVEFSVTQ